jgi:hypothetical protein
VSLSRLEAPETRSWCLAFWPPGRTDTGRVSQVSETERIGVSARGRGTRDACVVSCSLSPRHHRRRACVSRTRDTRAASLCPVPRRHRHRACLCGLCRSRRTLAEAPPKRKQKPRAKIPRFNEQWVVFALEADRRTDPRRDRKLKRLVAREIAIDMVRFAVSRGWQGEKTSVTGPGAAVSQTTQELPRNPEADVHKSRFISGGVGQISNREGFQEANVQRDPERQCGKGSPRGSAEDAA